MSERDLVRPVAVGEGVSPEERLLTVATQALQAGFHRTGLTETLHTLIERLPSETSPSQAAVALQRLLAVHGLDGLKDEQGVPSHVAAARALLALGHPHALAIAPEQLEALRRWERDDHPLPWESLVVPLLVAAALQVWLANLGSEDIRYMFHEATPEALAGMPPVERSWREVMWATFQSRKGLVFWGLLLSNLAVFLFAQRASALGSARRGGRLAFLLLGVLGTAAGIAQFHFQINSIAAWGTLASAAGSFLACMRLRAP